MTMTFRQTVELAHSLGAKFENGRWYFPTEEARATYNRRVNGLEWTPAQHQTADAALASQRELLVRAPIKTQPDMEPEGK